MEKLVAELKNIVPFKEGTNVGDVVLLAGDNPRMLVYAMVLSIEPDSGRKDPWWHVRMMMLSVPPQEIVWTLREAQFTGEEIFTMGGDKRFVQAIRLDVSAAGKDVSGPEDSSGGTPMSPGAGMGLRRLK